MFETDKKFKWHKTTAKVWQSNAQRSAAIVGTITYNDVDPEDVSYDLTSSDLGVSGSYATLKLAKAAFSKYTHTQS